MDFGQSDLTNKPDTVLYNCIMMMFTYDAEKFMMETGSDGLLDLIQIPGYL